MNTSLPPNNAAESALDNLIKQTAILKSKLATLEGYSTPSRVMEDIEKSSLELAKEFPSTLPPNVESLMSRIKFDPFSNTTSNLHNSKPLAKTSVAEAAKKELSEWEKVLEKATSQISSCASQKGNIQAKVMAYSERIVPLNNARVSPDADQLRKVIRDFVNVPSQAEYEVRMDQMADCWRITETLCSGVKGNDFAVKFLELMYLRHVEKVLAQFPRDALLGGRPTVVERIKAFVGIKLKRMSPADVANLALVGGVACWAVVFYLLRTGHVQEALQYCRQVESLSGKSGFELTAYLEAYLNDAITPSIRAQIHSDYNQRNLLGNQDVFLLALFKILGKCDMGKKALNPEVMQTIEDWLWLQFKLLNTEYYPFAELQQSVAKLAMDNALMNFQMLLLTRQYAKAIGCLWATDFGKVDAVHFALCMFVSNLVKNTDGNELIVGENEVNLSLLVAVYNKAFAKKYLEPNYLVHYSLLLSNLSVGEEAVAQAVIESGNYGFWLGDVQSDGTTSRGALLAYTRLIGDLSLKVSSKAAKLCIAQNRLSEALQLLNLSGDYDRVLKLVNDTLVKNLLDSSNKADLGVCQAVVDFYGGNNSILRQLSRAEYQKSLLMLRLVEFRTLCLHEKDYERALATMEMLDLLPLKGDIVVRVAVQKQ